MVIRSHVPRTGSTPRYRDSPEQIPIIFEADQAVRKRAVQDFDTVVGNCSVIDGENLELWKIRDRVNRRV
ncbi:hypothetical protein [Rubripirellula obstinata]|uniref:hypothetical protein n=1 Tax=Rubripirellula obstinata TaxID=406547 RepID=UPI00122CDD9B|nr:hypothetical protein [Rubripirellula obstinata]